MKPKLLHVLGAGPWQLPTVRLAKSIGYRVLVTDVYAERPAYALADFHEVVDITDLNVPCKLRSTTASMGLSATPPMSAYRRRLSLPSAWVFRVSATRRRSISPTRVACAS
jgi:hypothetical protein